MEDRRRADLLEGIVKTRKKQKMKKKIDTLKTIELTNGEFGELQIIYHFLVFLKKEGFCIQDIDNPKEVDSVFTKYVKYVRLEQMQYISNLCGAD